MAVGARALESLVMRPDAGFWRGKRVLLTGHTGFKGAWLALWLQRLGAEPVGFALPPSTQPSLFALAGVAGLIDSRLGDVRDAAALQALVRAARPQIVLHLAAQALVLPSYEQPLETFSTNVMGTANLLDAVRANSGVRVAVVVTTDKVYQNREWVHPYREEDALGGCDPYSASKAAAELVVASYRASFLATAGTAVASARAGNVIGGGDWARDRLLPDAFRAWSAGRVLEVRRPQAVRPWQHVLEPLAAYLCLAEKCWHDPQLALAYNIGPRTDEVFTVQHMALLARAAFGRGELAFATQEHGPHEAATLTLETARARQLLGVRPHWPVAEAVRRTMDWYRLFDTGVPARDLCLADIADYEAGATSPGGAP